MNANERMIRKIVVELTLPKNKDLVKGILSKPESFMFHSPFTEEQEDRLEVIIEKHVGGGLSGAAWSVICRQIEWVLRHNYYPTRDEALYLRDEMNEGHV